jgi:hypothetical protein
MASLFCSSIRLLAQQLVVVLLSLRFKLIFDALLATIEFMLIKLLGELQIIQKE